MTELFYCRDCNYKFSEWGQRWARCPNCGSDDWGDLDASGELRVENTRLKRAEAELSAVVAVLQRYQPAGSPPPGGAETLAIWILEHQRQEIERLRAELAKYKTGVTFEFRYDPAVHDRLEPIDDDPTE